ncbi:MAG TPA: metal ABC transporter permease [Clostridiaceae bacterium]|nr:metal ABC transporter permease [Clostridiaceae bacterium]
MEIFKYDFMIKAFLVGGLIAIIAPCIGIFILLKRLSMIGHSLSHTSLAGVAVGLIAGINPILGATAFSVIAALSIEKIRKSFTNYSEIAIAIITSAGIGLAGVLSGFIKSSATFNNFLFGSIVAISNFEVILVSVLSVIILLTIIVLYKPLFYIAFDEESSRLAGIPVSSINFLFTLLTAIAISISSRTVGALIISSLMVIPVSTAMQVGKSFANTLVLSIIFSLISTFSGLFISFYTNLKPGGTIVLVGVILLILTIFYKNILKRYCSKLLALMSREC